MLHTIKAQTQARRTSRLYNKTCETSMASMETHAIWQTSIISFNSWSSSSNCHSSWKVHSRLEKHKAFKQTPLQGASMLSKWTKILKTKTECVPCRLKASCGADGSSSLSQWDAAALALRRRRHSSLATLANYANWLLCSRTCWSTQTMQTIDFRKPKASPNSAHTFFLEGE